MPKINPDAPRIAYKFKGKTVQVPHYFTTGQALDEMEARFAQRQLASVTGNVLSSAITRKIAKMNEANAALTDDTRRLAAANEDGTIPQEKFTTKDAAGVETTVERPASYVYTETDIDEPTAQAMFDEIFASYEIGANNNRGEGEGSVHDPVESIARNMAWEIGVKPLLKDKGFKLNAVTAELKAKLVGQYLDQYPSLRETAKVQFDNARKVTTGDLDSIIASMSTPAASTEATTPDDANAGTEGESPSPAPSADAAPEADASTGKAGANASRQRQPAE